MKVQNVLDWLNAIAPFDTAEGFDNVGLIMGDPECEVTGVIFGLDITRSLIQQAIDAGANLIVTHHPFLFHAFKRIRYDSFQGESIGILIQHRIHVIAVHTNWDKAEGGISDSLAACLELGEIIKADPYLRVGRLPKAMSSEELGAYVSKKLHVLPHVYGEKKVIQTLAVAGGAYGEAALYAEADALVTGEIPHHDILEGIARDMVLVCGEHYATEFPGLKALMNRFEQELAPDSFPVLLHTAPPFPGAVY